MCSIKSPVTLAALWIHSSLSASTWEICHCPKLEQVPQLCSHKGWAEGNYHCLNLLATALLLIQHGMCLASLLQGQAPSGQQPQSPAD